MNKELPNMYPSQGCFFCDQKNPLGLKLHFLRRGRRRSDHGLAAEIRQPPGNLCTKAAGVYRLLSREKFEKLTTGPRPKAPA